VPKHLENIVQQSNICVHIKENLKKQNTPLKITPLFIERVLIEKYYEKYWLCEACAKEHKIPKQGILWFNQDLRNFHEEIELGHSADDNFTIEIPRSLKNKITQTCRKFFLEKYKDQVEQIESHTNSLIEHSITVNNKT
jgi:hypothetical protein